MIIVEAEMVFDFCNSAFLHVCLKCNTFTIVYSTPLIVEILIFELNDMQGHKNMNMT